MKQLAIIVLSVFSTTISVAQFVGIGNPIPTEKLDVAGNIKASGIVKATGYTHLTPKTYYYSLSGSDFIGKMSSDYVERETVAGGGVFASSGTTTLTAALHFPHDATITKMTAFYYDNSATVNLQIILRQNSSASAMASILSGGAPGSVSSFDNTINSATIDNSLYAYTLDVDAINGAWPGVNLILKKIVFEYTLSNL